MILYKIDHWLKFLVTVIVLISTQSNAVALTVKKSDILLHIVSQCIDPSKENYCSKCMLPRVDANCGRSAECKQTNEVWEIDKKYVAIRDIKMCGCPSDFVHGLAMPQEVVTGIEDSNRQESIWQFAWNAAERKIEPELIALAINPQSKRTQNQLHIHLVRLNQNARENFSQYSPVFVNNLEDIWATAEKDANTKGLKDYGVLLAQQSQGQYLLITTANSPEAEFTQWSCN